MSGPSFRERLSAMTDLELANATVATLSAIMQMSDRAKSNGGASCISGVASLNTMQQSIQKNGVRMADFALEINDRLARQADGASQ